MSRPVTMRLYKALMLNNMGMLSPACLVDFGLDGEDKEEKFYSLQIAVRKGALPQDLDAALGNGKKLTALIQKYGGSEDVVFSNTAWDILEDCGIFPDN